MNEATRFLKRLASVIEAYPIFTPTDTEPRHGPTMAFENDLGALRGAYQALPERLKLAIEPEWVELGVLIGNANTLHVAAHELYLRVAARLESPGDAFDEMTTEPLPRINGRRVKYVNGIEVRPTRNDRRAREMTPVPGTPGRVPVVGPAELADEATQAASPRRRLAAIGATAVAVAALVLAVLLPESPTSRTPTPIRMGLSAPTPLPISAEEYAMCEVSAAPVAPPAPAMDAASRPAPALAQPSRSVQRKARPERRKSAEEQFVKDIDTVIVRREGKPNLKVTVTELPNDIASRDNIPQRARTVNLRSIAGYGLEIPVDDGRVVVEIGK